MKVLKIVAATALLAGVGTTSLFIHGAGADTAASPLTPITPCRLIDTRPPPYHVGDVPTALGPGQVVTVAVAGTHGNCTIPANATGIAANVTITNPTAPGFLTLYPSGTARPNASNINWVAGQEPTANSAVIGLAGGTIDVFNYDGTVDVIIDISGYYTGALPTGATGTGSPPASSSASASSSGGPAGAGSAAAWGNVTGFLTTPTLVSSSPNVTAIRRSDASTDYGAAARSYCIAFTTPIAANQLSATIVGGFYGANSPVATVSTTFCKAGELGVTLFDPYGTALVSSQNGSFTFMVP